MPHTLPSISMTIPALHDERGTSLPPIGHDISRPPSASTASDRRGSHHGSEHGGDKVTLPGLSTLANVASQGNSVQQRPVGRIPERGNSLDESRHRAAVTNASQGPSTQQPSYSNASPTPTSVAGQGNVPPVCQNCSTSTTPLWRRDEAGSVLCNACGLFLKLHGRPRPISLKTDVIKSRNRVKSTAQTGRRKMQFTQGPHGHPLPPAQHPDLATPPPHPSYRRVSDQHMGAFSDRSASPISRAGTPASLHPHHTYPGHPHTAPPLTHHIFDPHHARSPSPMPVAPPPAYHSAPSTIAHRGNSPLPIGTILPGPTLPLPVPTVNAHARSPSLAPSHPGGLTVPELQTRVSELEVINSLYKSKVQELESAHDRDLAVIQNLQRELDEMRSREFRHDRQPLSERPPEYPRQAPPEPPSEPINYAEMTGSMKRRRGRTLERAAEESRLYGNKRRETGEFPQPAPAPAPVHA